MKTSARRPLVLALAASIAATSAAAQVTTSPPLVRSGSFVQGSGTVGEAFDADVIEVLFPAAPYAWTERMSIHPDGGVIIGVQTYNFSLFQTLYVVAHIDLDTNAVTVLMTGEDVQSLVPFKSIAILDSLEVAPNGDIYMAVSEAQLDQGIESTVFAKLPWNGSPQSVGAPVVFDSFDAPLGHPTAIVSIDDDGTVYAIRDDGDPVSDLAFLASGNGLYLLNELGSPALLPIIGYDSLATVLSGGGPAMTGAPGADMIGVSNLEVANGGFYFSFSSTSNTDWDDNVDGEVYDGDIVTIQPATGIQLLISRADLVAAYSSLIPAGIGTFPIDGDIQNVELVVDHQRNRLYTIFTPATLIPGPFTQFGENGHVAAGGVLQWDLRTGAFEEVVATAGELVEPWVDEGEGGFTGVPGIGVAGVDAARDSASLAPDGSILLSVRAPSFPSNDKILRITPAGL